MKVGDKVKFEVYCDESRQDLFSNKNSITKYNKFICIGGIWVESSIREEIKNKIKELKKKHKVNGEFKWKTVCPSKYNFFEELVELFNSYHEKDLRFRCIVINSKYIDMEKYNNNDSELGFYKFYYQLLNKWIVGDNDYKIFTDFKVNKKNDRLIELRKVLNNSSMYSNVEFIQAINSKESLMLQFEDVLMGIIAYKFNFNGNGKSEAKNNLVKKLEETYSDISNISYNKKLNIFKINLRGDKY
ncbi:MAG: DUF3800 domain-containing protein [Sarcina sp.]